LEDFTAWASSRTDIQAVALVGSYARGTAKDSSDIDLVLISKHPEHYLKKTEWITRFGHIQRQQTEDYGKLIAIRTWYFGGLEVEYGITDEDWVTLPLDEGTLRVIQDGLRILFERNRLLSHIMKQIDMNTKPPNQIWV
jgi:predicted nucleotidyltransferase